MAEPFVGEIRMFPYQFAPRNWAYCDGEILPIAQNQLLFAVISNLYGGDGRNTMAVPDLRGRSPMHSGRGPGLSYHQLSEQSGVSGIVLEQLNLPSHNHTATVVNQAGEQTKATNNFIANAPGVREYKESPASLAPLNTSALSDTGGNQAHENRQPYLAVPFCIALEGLYPPRS